MLRSKVFLIATLLLTNSLILLPASHAVTDLNSGLVGYWNFDNGNDVGYSTVGAISLSPYGTPAYTPAGGGHSGGRGLQLDGNSAIGTTNPITNLPLGAHPYTLSAWINATDPMGNGGIIGYGTPSSYNISNNLRLNGFSSIHHYWYANDLTMYPSGVDFRNSWHHVTATWDGTTRSLFLDGILQSSDVPVAPNFTADSFVIGRTLNDQNFSGTLDDVAIYDRALTQIEITALASTGISSAISPPTISSAAITGNARVGQTLSAATVGASGTITTTSYKWQRSEKLATGFTDITGAVAQTYSLTARDSEKYVRVILTISNSSGSVSATSSPTARIAEGMKEESKGDKKSEKDEGKKK